MDAMPALNTLGSDYGALARCMRSRSAERGEQLRFLRFRDSEVPIFHVAVAANVLGNLRQLHREVVIVRRECAHELVDERLVLPWERAPPSPLGGATEHGERP